MTNQDYRGLLYQSDSELYTLYILFELQDNNIIKNLRRCESYILSEKVSEVVTITKQLKTKVKVIDKEVTILNEHIYTPEFKFEVCEGYKNLVSKVGLRICEDNSNTYIIEVKNDSYDFHNMTRLAIINTKWMYYRYKLYINILTPISFMSKYFLAKEYLTTAKTKQARKIKFNYILLEDFINKFNE